MRKMHYLFVIISIFLKAFAFRFEMRYKYGTNCTDTIKEKETK